ncbi:MAG: tyrosine--tRNA ligase [Candidatus Erginobacter occultus]|nr:tyrosine--tRNA ligase [Candidatus Erginobacter occultus]
MAKDPVAQQMEVIRRGAVAIVPEAELEARLRAAIAESRPLRVKYGADPSAPDIHLGHTVPLGKLRQFQDLGHLVVFIIGDFTALVGDPSGRSKTRRRLSPQEVKENALTYQDQVFKILDRERTEVVYNSHWLSPMRFPEIVDLASRATVARMLERDDFAKRYREGKPISVLEFLYPLMQGYDSVMVRADVELGGTDQTFNLLLAREIQREYGQPPQAIVTLPLLEGTDGVQKMSKSLGNYIGVSEPPRDIFGKVMSVSDELMWRYYELLSRLSAPEIAAGREECRRGTNPIVWKKKLAYELAARFSDPGQAAAARDYFEEVHQKKEVPERMPEVEVGEEALSGGTIPIIDLLRLAGLVPSNAEARRKIAEGAVSYDGEKVNEHGALVRVKDNGVLKLGKRKFRRTRLSGGRKNN